MAKRYAIILCLVSLLAPRCSRLAAAEPSAVNLRDLRDAAGRATQSINHAANGTSSSGYTFDNAAPINRYYSPTTNTSGWRTKRLPLVVDAAQWGIKQAVDLGDSGTGITGSGAGALASCADFVPTAGAAAANGSWIVWTSGNANPAALLETNGASVHGLGICGALAKTDAALDDLLEGSTARWSRYGVAATGRVTLERLHVALCQSAVQPASGARVRLVSPRFTGVTHAVEFDAAAKVTIVGGELWPGSILVDGATEEAPAKLELIGVEFAGEPEALIDSDSTGAIVVDYVQAEDAEGDPRGGAFAWFDDTTTAIGGDETYLGTLNAVKGNGAQVGGADITTLDFSSEFGVAESPDTEINVTIGSALARDAEVAGYFADPSSHASFSSAAWLADLGVSGGGGGTGTLATVSLDGTAIDTDIATLNLEADDFDGSESPENTANLSIDASVTRDAEWDTWNEIASAASGLLAEAELDSALLRDSEAAAIYQAKDVDLTALAGGITGLVKGAGNGAGYAAATAGTDYLAPADLDERLGTIITATLTADGWGPSGSEDAEDIEARTAALQASVDAAYERGDAWWTPPFPAGSVFQISTPIELPTSDYTAGVTTFRPMVFDWQGVCLTRADNFVGDALIKSAGYDYFVATSVDDNDPDVSDAQWIQDGLPNGVTITNLRANGRGGINDNPWYWDYSQADGGAVGSTTTMPYTCDVLRWFGVLNLDRLTANDVPGCVIVIRHGGNPREGAAAPGDLGGIRLANISWIKALSGVVVLQGADGEITGVNEGAITRDVGVWMNSAAWRVHVFHVHGCLSAEPPADIDINCDIDLPKRFVGNGCVSGGNGANHWGEIHTETARICMNVDGDGENDGSSDGGAAGSTFGRLRTRGVNALTEIGLRLDSGADVGAFFGDFTDDAVGIEMTGYSIASHIGTARIEPSDNVTGIIWKGPHNKLDHAIISGASTAWAIEFGENLVNYPANGVIDLVWNSMAGGVRINATGGNNRVRSWRSGGGGSGDSVSGTPAGGDVFTEFEE